MKVLVTGSKGFIGKNVCAHLKNLIGQKLGETSFTIEEIYQWQRKTPLRERQKFCQQADFVFHFAGVNRINDEADYLEQNLASLKELLDELEQAQNFCPIIFASSIQAIKQPNTELTSYGKAKVTCEELLLRYGEKTKAPVYIYRLPNVFGKWCRPHYNSVVATFCHQMARNLPVVINDEEKALTLLYIDDLVDTLIQNLQGKFHFCQYEEGQLQPCAKSAYLYVPTTFSITVGQLFAKLQLIHQQATTLLLPEQPSDSLMKRLYATYVSYLPADKVKYPLVSHRDERGHFTEIFKFMQGGQVSVNVSKPKITKGKHWHHTKWEFFVVLSGQALIEQRKIDGQEILRFEVSGENLEVVHMLPGYVHQITNLSDSEDLITLMWANETFDPQRPDTFYEEL